MNSSEKKSESSTEALRRFRHEIQNLFYAESEILESDKMLFDYCANTAIDLRYKKLADLTVVKDIQNSIRALQQYCHILKNILRERSKTP